MNRFFLSIGSNLKPSQNIPVCLDLLRKKFQIIKTSSIYETEPVGPAGQSKFWNLVVEIETEKDRSKTAQELQSIEKQIGRKRDSGNKFAPRQIDIDLLPQPDYQKLAFIMIPLAEIEPDEKDVETGKKFQELAESLKINPEQIQLIRRA